jgi:hypothetical protein
MTDSKTRGCSIWLDPGYDPDSYADPIPSA